MNKTLAFAFGFMLIAQTLASGSVTINGITLTPVISGTNLELTVTGNNAGYIGLGFGNSMTNVDMLILTQSANVVSVMDVFSKSAVTPTADSTQSGSDNATVSGSYSDGAWNVVITRPIAATDSGLDAAIQTSGSQVFTVALGSGFDLSIAHKNYVISSINFSDASQTVAISSSLLSVCLASLISLFVFAL